MNTSDYQTSITASATAQEAFDCINKVTQWWTEDLEGRSHELNDVFVVRFGDVHYSKQQLVEVVPDQKVVWLVTDSRLNFIEDKEEWTNTKISFELSDAGDGKTQVRFTHYGLTPNVECYDTCSNVWGQYIQGSLLSLINTGMGHPTPKES